MVIKDRTQHTSHITNFSLSTGDTVKTADGFPLSPGDARTWRTTVAAYRPGSLWGKVQLLRKTLILIKLDNVSALLCNTGLCRQYFRYTLKGVITSGTQNPVTITLYLTASCYHNQYWIISGVCVLYMKVQPGLTAVRVNVHVILNLLIRVHGDVFLVTLFFTCNCHVIFYV